MCMDYGMNAMEYTPEEYVEHVTIENNTAIREETIVDAFVLAYKTGYEMAIMSYGSDQVQLIPNKSRVQSMINQTGWSDMTLVVNRDTDGFEFVMPHEPKVKDSAIQQSDGMGRGTVMDEGLDHSTIAQVNVFMQNWWSATENVFETILEHVTFE